MTKQKMLLTGSAGFIGSNFVRRMFWLKKNYEIVSIDKIANSSLLNNIYIKDSHKFYLADITDQHCIDKIFEFEKPDVVVHMAAETFVDKSFSDQMLFIKTNVIGTQNLATAAVKWGVKKFVLVSTDEAYGQLSSENDKPWTENDMVNPRNPYSASKVAAEFMLKSVGFSTGLKYNITRGSNTYGARQKEKLIPTVIKSILNDKKIPIYGKGDNIRDWLNVADHCDGILKVVESGKDNEIYNIGAGQEFSNIEVVQLICNAMGKGMNLIDFVKDPRPSHDFRYALNSDKLKNIGWAPKIKFKDGIKQCVEWYLNNQHWVKE